MTVAASGFHKIGQVGSGQIAVYKTADAIATVIGANYFGAIAKDVNLQSGDVIIVVDTNVPTVDVLIINAVDQDAETNTVVNGT